MPYRLTDLLRDCQTAQVGVAVPEPLSGRLDQLVSLADDAGLPTTRKELIAALILGAATEPTDLAGLVATYRQAQVRDAVVPGRDDSGVLDPQRPRGPRARPRPQR